MAGYICAAVTTVVRIAIAAFLLNIIRQFAQGLDSEPEAILKFLT